MLNSELDRKLRTYMRVARRDRRVLLSLSTTRRVNELQTRMCRPITSLAKISGTMFVYDSTELNEYELNSRKEKRSCGRAGHQPPVIESNNKHE